MLLEKNYVTIHSQKFQVKHCTADHICARSDMTSVTYMIRSVVSNNFCSQSSEENDRGRRVRFKDSGETET